MAEGAKNLGLEKNMPPSSQKKYSLDEIEAVVRLVIAPVQMQVGVVDSRLQTMGVILTGDGRPENGLVSGFQTLKHSLDLIEKRVSDIEKRHSSEDAIVLQKKTSFELKAWQVFVLFVSPIITAIVSWYLSALGR